MSDAQTKVFVVDDHELVRKGLIDLINFEPDLNVIGSASDYDEALVNVAVCLPDVAVVDVSLPGGNGIELCKELSSQHPGLRIIILTSFLDDEAQLGAALNGAWAFLLKDIKNLDLLNVIRRVGAGERLLDIASISDITSRLRGSNNPASEIYELSDQELKVVRYIGLGMTNRQVGTEMFLAEKTIKNYVSSILRKLGLDRRSQVAALAVRLGVTKD